MKTTYYPLALLLLILGLSSISLSAQKNNSFGKYYIYTIAINDYLNWNDLKRPESDAVGLTEVLTNQYGFKEIVSPLLSAQATKETIIASIKNLSTRLGKEDNLIILYSGHGHVVKKEKLIGYLVPHDAASAYSSTATNLIEIDHFLKLISELPAKHITVFLDACHSGIALSDRIFGYKSDSYYLDVLNKNKSRKVFTAARADQLAMDGGPENKYSLYAGELIKGLQNRTHKMDDYDWIHMSELALSLQKKVVRFNENQTPDFGAFFGDNRGEMILIPNGVTVENVKVEANFDFLFKGVDRKIKRRSHPITYSLATIGLGGSIGGSILRNKGKNEHEDYLNSINIKDRATIGASNPLYNKANTKYKNGQYLQIGGAVLTGIASYYISKALFKRKKNE